MNKCKAQTIETDSLNNPYGMCPYVLKIVLLNLMKFKLTKAIKYFQLKSYLTWWFISTKANLTLWRDMITLQFYTIHSIVPSLSHYHGA